MKRSAFIPFVIYLLASPWLLAPASKAFDGGPVTGAAVVHEINMARQNPTLYATFLEQTRQSYAGRVCSRNVA